MTPRPLVFLDANVLFSAALGGEVFGSILELADIRRVTLVSSRACVAEAVTNLTRKRPERMDAFAGVLVRVRLEEPDIAKHLTDAEELVGADDAHVLATALALQADLLVTGDRRDFARLMERSDLPLTVRTPRAFLGGESGHGPRPPVSSDRSW